MSTLTLADVDGTIPGRAVLVVLDLTDPASQTVQTDFTEGRDGEDPTAAARSLQKAVRAQMPDCAVAILCNPRAKYIEWKLGMRSWGRNDFEPERYLEIHPEMDL